MQKSSCTTCGGPISPTVAEIRKGYATCTYCGASMKLDELMIDEEPIPEQIEEEKKAALLKQTEELNRLIERPAETKTELKNEPGKSFEFRFPSKPYWTKNVLIGWIMILSWHLGVILGAWLIVHFRTWPALFFLAIALGLTGWFWYYVFSAPGQTYELKMSHGSNRITIGRYFFGSIKKKTTKYKNITDVFFEPSKKILAGKNVFILYVTVDGEKKALFSGVPPSEDQRWVYSEFHRFIDSISPS